MARERRGYPRPYRRGGASRAVSLVGNVKMRMAIVTKYLPPANYRGARVKARAEAGSITIPWNYELDAPGNHRTAALALMARLGWDWPIAGGDLPGAGYVFVEVPKQGQG